jgi:hypothetical protein
MILTRRRVLEAGGGILAVLLAKPAAAESAPVEIVIQGNARWLACVVRPSRPAHSARPDGALDQSRPGQIGGRTRAAQKATTPCCKNQPWPRDANKMASGKPGAVQSVGTAEDQQNDGFDLCFGHAKPGLSGWPLPPDHDNDIVLGRLSALSRNFFLSHLVSD